MVVKLDRVRYIKILFHGNTPSVGQFVDTLRREIKKLAGEIILATSGVHVVEYNNNSAIVRCTNKSRDVVESALQLIEFNSFNLKINKVSGTLKTFSKSDIDDELLDD